MAAAALLSVWLLISISADGLVCPDEAYYRSSSGDCATQCRCGETAQLYYNTTTGRSYKTCVPISSLYYSKAAYNTSLPISTSVLVGTQGPALIASFLLYVNYDQFGGSGYANGYSGPYLYSWNTTSWDVEGISALFNHSSFSYNPLNLYLSLNTSLSIAKYSNGNYPLSVQSAEYRCYDSAGTAYLGYLAAVYLHNTVVPPGNYTIDLNTYFYGDRYEASSSMQILISVRQVCLRGLKFVATEGNSSSCVYVCPCGSVEYLGICSYGTIGISPLFQEQYVSPSAGAGDGVMSVLVTLEDRGLRNSQIQLYIYSDLYAVFLGGSPWTYGYLHPFFSTRPSAQSSVVTWQDVKARASVCSSGSKSYVTFPVNIFLSSRSLFNLGQLFVYFDFAYGSVYSRSTLLLNVNAGCSQVYDFGSHSCASGCGCGQRRLPSVPFCVPYQSSDLVIFSDEGVTISVPYDQQVVPGYPVTITVNPKHTLLSGNSPITLHLEVAYAYSAYLTGIRGGSPVPQVMLAFPGGNSSSMKDFVLPPSSPSLIQPCARKTDGSLFWQIPFQVAVETQGYFSVLANHTYILSASFSSPGHPDLTNQLQLYNHQIVITVSIQSDGTQGASFFTKCQRDLIEGQDYLPYIDLRSFHTTTTIASGLDSVSDVIYIPNGAPFGSSFQTQAYVASNGLISFGRPSTLSSPLLFPSRDVWTQSSYLVAPFWCQSDTRKAGVVSYITLDRTSSDDAAIQSLFNNVSSFISKQMMGQFSGSWMLVVTWSDIHPYPHGSYSNDDLTYKYYGTFISKSNTFQAIVTSDGANTYAVFTYDCNLMQWSGFWTFATVGYNANGAYFRNHPASGYDVISEAVACQNMFCNVSVSNVVYQLSQVPSYASLQRQLCYALYLDDLGQLDLSKASSQLEPCPCSWGQAWIDQSRFIWSRDARLCFVQRFPKEGTTYVQQCCYGDDKGALVTYGAERGTMLRYDPQRYPELYSTYDLRFKEACCGVANMSSLFYARRPTDDCVGYQPPALTWGWGDPHITTLDGRGYTFNGWGEYTLLQSQDNATGLEFTFQGRMVPLDGSNATRYTAFAFRDHRTPVVEIGRGVDNHFYVLVGGKNITSSLGAANGFYDGGGGVQLSAATNQSISCFLSSGVGVSVNVSHGVLCFVLSLPAQYRGKTLGLLGNYNGNMSDEFIARGATVPLPDGIGDRALHWRFAQTWNVSQQDSLFSYGAGMSWRDHSHPLHQPAYPDEITYTTRQHMVCGSDIFCLYDLYQTESEEFAISTITIDQITRLGALVLNHFPPAIRGNASYMVIIGQPSYYYFVVEDTNDVTVGVVGGVPPGATLVSTHGQHTFTWTLGWVQNVSLVFFAIDSSNLTSFLSVQVELCACQNGGNCTLDGLVGVASGQSVIMNCVCGRAYEGQFCEGDRSGCAETSCYHGVQCFDVPAPGVGIRCGPCPNGYTGDGQNCIGIDECAINSSLCQQQCIDVVGSYTCVCFSGFQLEPNGTCVDVDECRGSSGCQQLCSNTIGSYVCGCTPGFLLSEDRHSCNGVSSCSPQNNCTQLCTRVNTTETCYCRPGYVLSRDNRTCTDLNECLHSICEQRCDNTIGSFVCGCWNGFKLGVDGRTCEDINECREAAITNTQLCSNTTQCLNLMGGFTCICVDGFVNISGKCLAPPGPLLNCTATPMAPGGLNMSCSVDQLVVFSCTLNGTPLPCESFPLAVNLTGLGTGYHTITVTAFNTFGASSESTILIPIPILLPTPILHSEQVSFQSSIIGSAFQPGPTLSPTVLLTSSISTSSISTSSISTSSISTSSISTSSISTSSIPTSSISTSSVNAQMPTISVMSTSEVTLSPRGYSESLLTGETLAPLSMTTLMSAPSPVVSSSAPGVSTPSPVLSYSAPVVSYSAPVLSSSSPVLSSSEPWVSSPSPVLSSSAPVLSSSAPVLSSSSPVVPSSAPGVSTPSPVLSYSAPVVSYSSPVLSSSSPVLSSSEPWVSSPSPVLSSSAPVLSSSAPVLSSSSPVVPSSAPGVSTPSPVLSSAPGVSAASPVLSSSAPVVSTPSPVVSSSAPVLSSSSPVLSSSSPVLSSSAPVVSTPSQRPEILISSPSTQEMIAFSPPTKGISQEGSISALLTHEILNSSSSAEMTLSSVQPSLSFMTSVSFQEIPIPSFSQEVTSLLTLPSSLSFSLGSSSLLAPSLGSSSLLAPSLGSSSLLAPSLGSSSPMLSFVMIPQPLQQTSTQLSNVQLSSWSTPPPSPVPPVLPVSEPAQPSSLGVAMSSSLGAMSSGMPQPSSLGAMSSVMPQPSSLGVAMSTVMPQPSSLGGAMSSGMPQPSSLGVAMSTVMPQPSSLGGAMSSGMPQPSSLGAMSTVMPQPSSLGVAMSSGMPQPSSLGAMSSGMPQPSSLGAMSSGMPQPSSLGAMSSVMPQPSSLGAMSSGMPQPSSLGAMSSVMPQPSSLGVAMSSVMPQLPQVSTTPPPQLLPNSTPSPSQLTLSQPSSLSSFSSSEAISQLILVQPAPTRMYSSTVVSKPLATSCSSMFGGSVMTGVSPPRTVVSPLMTGVSPLMTRVSPLMTGVSPLMTGVSLLTTGVSPLVTGVPPLVIGVPPLTTGVSPLMTGVSPLMTGVSPLMTRGTTQAQLQPSQWPENSNYVAVNDTVIADPVLTLPLYLPDGAPLKMASLCYDLHGRPNTYYNLVSDSCTSVNAHYQRGIPDRTNVLIIVLDEIALRAVDRRGSCVDVAVDINCNVAVNGVRLASGQYIKEGVSVHTYADRVRLSVPNCVHQQLVMWVMCQIYRINHPTTGALLDVKTLKFVVARTLSLNENSHGLIAQFWGVPVSLVPYRGQYRGQPVTTSDFYVISVATKPRPRHFVAHWNAVTWDSREGPCLYAGSGNGGPIFEVISPNDPVIEGVHTDYITGSRFATSFKYSRFTGNCT